MPRKFVEKPRPKKKESHTHTAKKWESKGKLRKGHWRERGLEGGELLTKAKKATHLSVCHITYLFG